MSLSNQGQKTVKKRLTFPNPCKCECQGTAQNGKAEPSNFANNFFIRNARTRGGPDLVSILPSGSVNIDADLAINGNLFSLGDLSTTNGCFTTNLDVGGVLQTNNIQPPGESALKIPNIKYNIDTKNTVLNPTELKVSKIFANDSNFMLNADDSCDGIEIVIYNTNRTNTIDINQSGILVCRNEPFHSVRLLYLQVALKWIIV